MASLSGGFCLIGGGPRGWFPGTHVTGDGSRLLIMIIGWRSVTCRSAGRGRQSSALQNQGEDSQEYMGNTDNVSV